MHQLPGRHGCNTPHLPSSHYPSTPTHPQMIKGFDKAVTGLAQGESRKVRLEPEEAYGAVREDAVITLPPTTKMPEGLVEGDKVQLSNCMAARVTKIGEEWVTLDLNHELAGGVGAATKAAEGAAGAGVPAAEVAAAAATAAAESAAPGAHAVLVYAP